MHIDGLRKDHYDERTNMLLKTIIVFYPEFRRDP
jgi:hypothetical protein